MNKSNLLKGLSLLAAGAGLVLNILNSFIDDKKMEQKIEEKVNEALSKREQES